MGHYECSVCGDSIAHVDTSNCKIENCPYNRVPTLPTWEDISSDSYVSVTLSQLGNDFRVLSPSSIRVMGYRGHETNSELLYLDHKDLRTIALGCSRLATWLEDRYYHDLQMSDKNTANNESDN